RCTQFLQITLMMVKASNPADFFILSLHDALPISCKPEVAQRHTGYQVGGTSPFGTRKKMPVWVEAGLMEYPVIYLNGGRRGYLIGIDPQALRDCLDAQCVNVGLQHS